MTPSNPPRSPRPERPARRNRWLAGIGALAVIAMLGLSFASAPLYRMFCAATGFGGTPLLGGDPTVALPGAARVVVRFDAAVDGSLPWRFAPARRQVEAPLGGEQVAFYTARNLSAKPVTGMALYNVTPEKAGRYFHKTACFCFDKQSLAPGQEMQFPVSFHVDPALAIDPGTRDVKTITLSYTFYRSLDDAAASGALARAGPHVGRMPTEAASAARP